MERSKERFVSLLVPAIVFAFPGMAAAQATCGRTEAVQFLSHGEYAPGTTSKVVCVVDYWACGKSLSKKSGPVENKPKACDAFTRAAAANIGNVACCDCFPNCGATGGVSPSGGTPVPGTRQAGDGGGVAPSRPRPPAPNSRDKEQRTVLTTPKATTKPAYACDNNGVCYCTGGKDSADCQTLKNGPDCGQTFECDNRGRCYCVPKAPKR